MLSGNNGIERGFRRWELEGFPAYRLEMPTAAAGALIFRVNYGAALTGDDRRELETLLEEPGLCHPLTLRMMAKAARSRGWSVGQLRRSLPREHMALSFVEEDRIVRIRKIFTQLYPISRVPRQLTQLFSLLPYDSYGVELLTALFPGACPERAALERDLDALSQGGWLECSQSGYAMHPLIAQCLRRTTLPQALLKFGQGENARALLERLQALEASMEVPSVTAQYFQTLGTWELYYGDLDRAAQAVEKALAVLEEHYGRAFSYHSTLNQLAIIFQRQRRFEDAKAAYEQILAYGEGKVYFHVARNNYAVLLLDMGMPREAMPHIDRVLEAARQQGGIALGEALRNQARAWGLLQEHGRECRCLQEALPLLAQAYGPEHPRVLAARERLAQLTGEASAFPGAG